MQQTARLFQLAHTFLRYKRTNIQWMILLKIEIFSSIDHLYYSLLYKCEIKMNYFRSNCEKNAIYINVNDIFKIEVALKFSVQKYDLA